MGGAESVSLLSPFEKFTEWTPSKVLSVIKCWIECETYGFDLDAEEAAALLSVPREDGELLLKKLNRKGTDFGEHRINALALLAGVVMLNCTMSTDAIAASLFDIFDLDCDGKLSIDETTIMLVTTERAVKVMMGIGVAWGDTLIESLADAIFSYNSLKTVPIVKYQNGDRVQCRYRRKARWYRARVTGVHPRKDVYDVLYDVSFQKVETRIMNVTTPYR